MVCVKLLYLAAAFASATAFKFPEECGINYIKPDNVANDTAKNNDKLDRIVGGYEAVPGSWPWQAYLVYKGTFVCGGTLIDAEWVLSAGHCFFEATNPSDWEVVLGEHDDTIEEGHEQRIQAAKIFLNPNYSDNDLDFDLTLIKLSRPAQLSDHVAPACLPSQEDTIEDPIDSTFPPGQFCITTGWGSTSPNVMERSSVLKQDNQALYYVRYCNDYFYPGWLTSRMICAFGLDSEKSAPRGQGVDLERSAPKEKGFDSEKRAPRGHGVESEKSASTGKGDDGGPLVCRHPDTGRWTQLGATSWGSRPTSSGTGPSVFASTVDMRDWIVEILEIN